MGSFFKSLNEGRSFYFIIPSCHSIWGELKYNNEDETLRDWESSAGDLFSGNGRSESRGGSFVPSLLGAKNTALIHVLINTRLRENIRGIRKNSSLGFLLLLIFRYEGLPLVQSQLVFGMLVSFDSH